uniref:Uncharacterized protein n=1 Tax=Lepeophtheirus salmonis TaxID=72036 RepID=A0A0K2VA78_LEPSM
MPLLEHTHQHFFLYSLKNSVFSVQKPHPYVKSNPCLNIAQINKNCMYVCCINLY